MSIKKKIVIATISLLLFLGLWILCFLSYQKISVLVSNKDSDIKVLNFKQETSIPQAGNQDNNFLMKLSVPVYRIKIYTLGASDVPIIKSKDIFFVLTKKAFYTTKSKKDGTVNFRLKEKYYNDNNLIMIQTKHSGYYVNQAYVILSRQSEKSLLNLYHFNKKGGYTVLGETNLNFPNTIASTILPNVYFRRALMPAVSNNLTKIVYSNDSSKQLPQSLQEAIFITKYIWSKPLLMGPNDNYNNYYLPALDQLNLLRAKQWSVECFGIQNIFNELAIDYAPHIKKIRAISLIQYNGEFVDLTQNTHAVSEIYDQKLQKWILFDAYFGVYFEYKGSYLSAYKLTHLKKSNLSQVKVIRVDDNAYSTNTEFVNVKKNQYQLAFYRIYLNLVQYYEVVNK